MEPSVEFDPYLKFRVTMNIDSNLSHHALLQEEFKSENKLPGAKLPILESETNW